MAKQRPGVVIYFEIRNSLKHLTDEQCGKLLKAILDYGEMGILPDFENDLALAITWEFVQPRVDRDGERYYDQIDQRKYAVYCREKKRKGEDPLPFDEWKASKDNDSKQTLSTDDECYPTSPTTSPTTASTSQLQPQPQPQSQPQTCMREPFGSVPLPRIGVMEDPGQDFENRRKEQVAKLLRGGL